MSSEACLLLWIVHIILFCGLKGGLSGKGHLASKLHAHPEKMTKTAMFHLIEGVERRIGLMMSKMRQHQY